METKIIKGTAQKSNEQIEGYVFPSFLKDFPIPSKILFAPNFTPILYKVENGKITSQSKEVAPRSVNVVGVIGNGLLLDNGLALTQYDPTGSFMLISKDSISGNLSNNLTGEYKFNSLFGIIGLAGGVYFAHKKKKGNWGYVGFGLLGLIAGNIIGTQISKLTKK
ncbi:MAG: hypothetical protein WCI04_00015 [archaeon]